MVLCGGHSGPIFFCFSVIDVLVSNNDRPFSAYSVLCFYRVLEQIQVCFLEAFKQQ